MSSNGEPQYPAPSSTSSGQGITNSISSDGELPYELLIVDFVGVCTAPLADLARTADPASAAVPVHPQAESVIQSARAAGIAVVVLSNDLPEATIKATPLLSAIDDAISLANSAITKPDRRAFERVMLAQQVPANRTLIADDSPENVRGAKSAGATALHFNPSDPRRSWDAVRTELGM